jgi:hypothetical protein
MTIGQVFAGGAIAPAWLVMPLAVVTLLVIAGHVLALQRADMPPFRKRLRTVNGVLMMFTVPVAAFAFAIIQPANQRLFIMVWMLVAGLLVLVLMLAVLDLAHTWLLAWHWKRHSSRGGRQGSRPAPTRTVNLLPRHEAALHRPGRPARPAAAARPFGLRLGQGVWLGGRLAKPEIRSGARGRHL